MGKYRKLLVAVLGAALVAVNTFFGFEVGFTAEGAANVLIPILTAAGVWGARNDA